VDVAHEKQIIVHTPFQLEDFVRFVVLRWQAFLSECAGARRTAVCALSPPLTTDLALQAHSQASLLPCLGSRL
jgi:hypothetical protein